MQEKKKRAAPAFMAIQTEVTRLIKEKEQINHKEALKKLKHYFELANKQPYEKNGTISWMDGLLKTKEYLSS